MISDDITTVDTGESPSLAVVGTLKQSSRSMHLKILRASLDNLAMIQNPRCRIIFENEVVGETPAREQTADPVWGGPSSSLHIQVGGREDSQILQFEILDDGDRLMAYASVPVSELLSSPTTDEANNGNPNRWCRLRPAVHSPRSKNQHAAAADTVGWVQVCLLPSQRAFLHAQPSTRILAAGPELLMAGTTTMMRRAKMMDSYAVRKGVMSAVTPVTLHVYDVSNDERIAHVNYYTKALGAGGIFHAAVEVYGREYSFGGSSLNVTGVFGCPPKRCPMHHYRESVFLGDCALSEDQVQAILRDLKPQWMARSYNLFSKNCCFFSREFAIELGVGTIPEWVYQMAKTGEFIEPYLIEYSKRQKMPNNSRRKNCPLKEAGKEKTTPESQPDRMVDHAMAARLQRSFRVRQSKKHDDCNTI